MIVRPAPVVSRLLGQTAKKWIQPSATVRFNSTSAAAAAAAKAKTYAGAGILRPGSKQLVDVEKVLVIGSGGLSIGQAGEFDYSGMCSIP